MQTSPQEVERIAKEAARDASLSPEEIDEIVRAAVNMTLTRIGIDPNDPIQAQKDFAHLRHWRESSERIKRKGMAVAVGTFISGWLALALIGFKDWLGL